MNNNENKPEHTPEKVVEVIEEVIVVDDGKIVEEIIDIEEYVRSGRKPPRAKGYKIRIDKLKYTVHVHEMNGTQILAEAGKTPDKYLLSQKLKGGKVVPVGPLEVVNFHLHEVERFQTLAKDPTEG
jgi:energy-coupling factor transporter ATP-binding protein EcfA2